MIGVLVALLAFSIAWLVFQREDPTAGGWDGLPLTLQLPALLATLLGGFIFGVIIAMQVPWLRRWFISNRHMQAEVALRARQAFFDQRIHHTRASNGLLIYISMYEKLAILLADQTVHEALGEAGLNALRDQLLRDLRHATVAEAICGVVHAAGEALAQKLPDDAAAPDELPDSLVVLE